MIQIFKNTKIIMAVLAILLSACIKGKEGPAGKDGNANVNGSNEFTSFSNNWTESQGGSNGTYYYVQVTSPLITETIINKGAVLCYYKLTDKTWAPLPYDVYSYIFAPGGMGIIYDNNTNPGTQTFRLVTIAASELSKHPEVDLKDFKEVSQAFLKE